MDEELQLLDQVFVDFKARSKKADGLDRDVFVKFCPLQGLWGHRVFGIMKQGTVEEHVNFE